MELYICWWNKRPLKGFAISLPLSQQVGLTPELLLQLGCAEWEQIMWGNHKYWLWHLSPLFWSPVRENRTCNTCALGQTLFRSTTSTVSKKPQNGAPATTKIPFCHPELLNNVITVNGPKMTRIISSPVTTAPLTPLWMGEDNSQVFIYTEDVEEWKIWVNRMVINHFCLLFPWTSNLASFHSLHQPVLTYAWIYGSVQ